MCIPLFHKGMHSKVNAELQELLVPNNLNAASKALNIFARFSVYNTVIRKLEKNR